MIPLVEGNIAKQTLPHFIVVEGVDGVGKSTVVEWLTEHYRTVVGDKSLLIENFPGSRPGSLGYWVRNLHQEIASGTSQFESVSPPGLQMLHIAAHVDMIVTRIGPTLRSRGYVVLDRFWWSAYAYSRANMDRKTALSLVSVEKFFWSNLPTPLVFYLTRHHLGENDVEDRVVGSSLRQIEEYYREIIEDEKKSGIRIVNIVNDGTLDDLRAKIVNGLVRQTREDNS